MCQTDLSLVVSILAAGKASPAVQVEAARAIQSLVEDYNGLVRKHNDLQDFAIQLVDLINEVKNRTEQRYVLAEQQLADAEAKQEAEREERGRAISRTINSVLHPRGSNH